MTRIEKLNKMKITYDDTRDIAILCVGKLIDLGHIEDNNDTYFEIQDAIQDEINLMLGIDIDDNFEITIKIANELSMKEKEMLLGLVTQAIEEIGLGEMEYLKPLQQIENKLK